ncbi:MAG: hypothetical protein GXY42_11930 [Desulfovibrionales bacterium]|nr:hypothetical protein [Desulfovibrionales bacterium]
MKNMNTLLHFMRYFEPHCIENAGQKVCYVSALEYPDKDEALEALGGNGWIASGPSNIELKYAGLVRTDDGERWQLTDEQLPGSYPVWEAR